MPLTRDTVLRRAVALADDAGLPALSMRKLGDALGVEAMSLYHHVKDKSALLDGMVDEVFAEIELPAPELGWRTALRQRSTAVRAALARHRWAIGLLESRAAPGPATLRHHDAVLGCLRRDGFSVPAAAHAYALLDSYVYGFALQEASLPLPTGTPGTAAELARGILDAATADYPYLTEMAAEHVSRPDYAFGAEFDVGLDLVLDAIATLHDERNPQ
jgi:AcrR family transcriptional regulator